MYASQFNPAKHWSESIGTAVFLLPLVTIFGSVIAYVGMLLFGVPSWLLLRFTNRERGTWYVLAGFLGGLLAPRIWDGSGSFFGEPWRLHGAVAGAFVMAFFWWISRKRAVPTAS